MPALKLKTSLKTSEGAANGLAWLSFVLAMLGGVTATASLVGVVISWVVGLFFWWLPFVLVAVVGLVVIGDVLLDGIPNRTAIYGAIVWPSFVISVQGRLGVTVRGWIAGLNRYLDASIAEWITDVPRGSAALMTGISMAAIAFAIVYAYRYADAAGATATQSPPSPQRALPFRTAGAPGARKH